MSTARKLVLFFFLLALPTQLGKHYFLNFSYVDGVRIDYLSIALYVTDILFVILAFLHSRHIVAWVKKHKHALVFFLILFLANIGQSKEPVLALYCFIKLIEGFFCYIIFKFGKIKMRFFFLPLFIGSIFELFLAIAQFVNKSSLQGIFYYTGERFFTLSTPGIAKASLSGQEILRPYATFPHPNSMAGFYLLIYAVILSISTQKNRFLNYIKYGLMLTCSMLILISFSKTAIITYVFINLIFLIKSSKRCKICLLSQFFIIMALGIVFTRIQADPFSLNKRLLLLSESLDILQLFPLLGTGLGNNLYFHAMFPSPFPYFHLQPVHNIFMLFLMQTGVIISALLSSQIFIFIVKQWKKAVLPLVVIFITGFFDHYWITLQQNILLFGTIFGFVFQGENKK